MMWLAVTTLELIGAVGSLAAVAALLVPLSGRVLKGRGTTIAPITLELSRSLWEDDRLSFKVYHVRDGKDQARDPGPPVGRAYAPRVAERVGDRVVAVANLRYAAALGVQFKCYVDFRDLEFDEVSRLLVANINDAYDVTLDGAHDLSRAWFLLRSYQTVKTLDDFTNNFIYPR